MHTRLRECMGIYRHAAVNILCHMHVAVNIVLFFATCMYTVV